MCYQTELIKPKSYWKQSYSWFSEEAESQAADYACVEAVDKFWTIFFLQSDVLNHPVERGTPEHHWVLTT